ncbi:RloB family protein [Nocardia sp. NPDC050175]|uniref:RloB family protein n=1 Tax=Nocardia sp. NPDC050175 TaxID=3364317 RepID=UPI00378ACBC3
MTTNGAKTEKTYLQAVVQEPWVSARIKKKKVQFINGGPSELVRKTAQTRCRIGFDRAYAVADRDDFDVDSALKIAQGVGIPLLISNPCFEAWLVLHFADCRKYLEDGDAAQQRLRKYLPTYEKEKLSFGDFAPFVQDAADRARANNGAPDQNPSSLLWMLIDVLRDVPGADSC